jgi:hypothetical protein
MDDSTKKLIPFLRDLADSVEKKELRPSQLRRVGDFFMAYQFQKQALIDHYEDDDSGDDQDTEDVHPEEEMIRFVVMGYYIYRHILAKTTIPDFAGEE